MSKKLSTGVAGLDRRLDGGLSPGDIVAVVSPPATQSHMLLYQFMRERPTVYITSLRSKSSIKRDFEMMESQDITCQVEEIESGVSMDGEFIQELTGSRTYSINSATEETALDEIYRILDSIDEPKNVIIDPINVLERDEKRDFYTELLKKLKTTTDETGGLGILHCMTLNEPPPFREETLMIADVVWELNTVSARNDNVEFQLRIPKNRVGKAVLEEITLQIDRQKIYVDDSRVI